MRPCSHTQTNDHSDVFKGILNEVSDLVSPILSQDIPSPETDLTNLGIDSIAMLEVLTALEEHFDITLNENLVREFRCLHDIGHIVMEQIRAK